MELNIAVISGLIASVSAVCSVIAFFISRRKSSYEDGQNDGGIRGDIKYMRNSFDELRLDVKEIARKQDVQGERLTRVEEKCEHLDHRLESVEKRVNHPPGE